MSDRDAYSEPLISKHVLRRMNQLEDKSRLSTRLPPSPALLSATKRTHMRGQPTWIAAPVPVTLASRSPALARSITAPELKMNMSALERKSMTPPRTRKSSEEGNPDPASRESICHSPSWSVKDRRKREKSTRKKKESKQESDHRGDSAKARKRLSKKPPVAMRTQGHVASSPPRTSDGSRASRTSSLTGSRERRGSFSSFTSTLRFPELLYKRGFHQPPTPPDEGPGFLFGTIKTGHVPQHSNSLSGAKPPSDDEVHATDVVEFSHEMGMPAQKAFEVEGEHAKVENPRDASLHTPVPMSLTEDTSIVPKAPTKITPKEQGRRESQNLGGAGSFAGKADNAAGGYRYPNFKRLLRREKTKTADSGYSSSSGKAIGTLPGSRSNSAPVVPMTAQKSKEKPIGYVQKSRSSHQQRSIAGFEDELAVKKATEALYIQSQPFEAVPEPLKQQEEGEEPDGEPEQTLSGPFLEPMIHSAEQQRAQQAGRSVSESRSNVGEAGTDEEQKSTQVQNPDAFALPALQISTGPILAVFPSHDVEGRASYDPASKTCQAEPNPSQISMAHDAELKRKNEASMPPVTRRDAAEDGIGGGLTGKRRRQSNAETKMQVGKASIPLLDPLPVLKHQSLRKPEYGSRPASAIPGSLEQKKTAASSDPQPIVRQFELRQDLPNSLSISKPKNGHDARRQSFGPGHGFFGLRPSHQEPVGKMFVICCKCQRWHDLPSKFYEAMALPRMMAKGNNVVQDAEGQGGLRPASPGVKGVEAKLFTAVKCPWCEHGMSTGCCQGWTTVVHLHERHH